MATALRQGKAVTGTSLAFTSNVLAGSILVCAALTTTTAATESTCTDTQGNTWVKADANGFNSATAGVRMGVWFTSVIAAGGACTVTPTFSGGAVLQTIIGEFTGPLSAAQDGTMQSVDISAGTNPWVTPSITTSASNCLLLHFAAGVSGGTPAFTSPWLLDATVPADVNTLGFRPDVSAGSYTPNLGWGANQTGGSVVVALNTPLPSTAAAPSANPIQLLLGEGAAREALGIRLLQGVPVVPPAATVVISTSQAPLIVTSPTPDFPGKTISPPARDGIVRSTPLPPLVVTKPGTPAPGSATILTGRDGLAPAGPGPLFVTRPTEPIPGTFLTRVGDPNAAPFTLPFTPTPLLVTSPTPLPIPQTLIRRGTDDALQLNSPGPKPLVVTSSAVVEGKTLIRRGTDDAIQLGTITPQPTVISARSVVPLPQVLTQQGGVTSTQVEASGTTGIVFGSTAIPTVSASGSSAIIFNATGVPTESAIGTSSIIFNSTGAGTTPGGVSTFVSMRGANSAFVNVASATTDAAFTGGIIPATKAGQCVNVLAVTFNADTAADTLVFNSKGAGAGTAISALFSNPINGSVVWPYTPVGWFTTNGGEALTVTTTGASPTHVQIIFEYINA